MSSNHPNPSAKAIATATRVGPLDAFFAPRSREQFQKPEPQSESQPNQQHEQQQEQNYLLPSPRSRNNDINNNDNENVTIPSIIVCLLPINDENEYEILNEKVLSRPVLTLTHVARHQHQIRQQYSDSNGISRNTGVSASASSATSSSNDSNTNNAFQFNGNGILSLGRNDTTMIQEMSISRHLATLSIHDVDDDDDCDHVGRNGRNSTSAGSNTITSGNQNRNTNGTFDRTCFKIILTIHKHSKSHHVHVNGKHVQSTSIPKWGSDSNGNDTDTNRLNKSSSSTTDTAAAVAAAAGTAFSDYNMPNLSLRAQSNLDAADSEGSALLSSSSSSSSSTITNISVSAQSQLQSQAQAQTHSHLTSPSLASQKLRPSLPPSPQCVIELEHGDVISLHKSQYRYKLHCLNFSPSNSNADDVSVKMERENRNVKVEEGMRVDPKLVKIEQGSNSRSVTTEGEATNSSLSATSLKRKHSDITSKQAVKVEQGGGNSNPSVEQDQEQEQKSSLSFPPPIPSLLLQHPLQIQAKQNILHELKCPICFEILIEATATNSCGHLFCYDCIHPIYNIGGKKKKKNNNQNNQNHNNSNSKEKVLPCCPTCRHDIESLTRLRMYDDLIWNMVCLNQVFFTSGNANSTNSNHNDERKGDLEKYLERSGKSVEDLNKDEKKCIFGSGNTETDAYACNTEATTTASPSQQRRLWRKEEKKKQKYSSSPSLIMMSNHDHDANMNGLFDLSVIRQQRQQLGGQSHSGTQDDPILL